jgi:hypothetical protein
MQTVSVNYLNTLKKAVSLEAKARLFAEWNHNRYAGPATVVNTGYTDADSDEFPLEAVVAPNRPDTRGILKARTTKNSNYATNGKPKVEGYVQAAYDDFDTGANSRSYTVSSDSIYKYWASPTRSGTTATSGVYSLASGSLEITYTADVWTNKIMAVFESSVVVPKNITVSYKTTAAGAWTAIAGTFQVNSDGNLVLYRQIDGSWSATEELTAPIKIRGIKVSVAGLDRADAYLNVIEISARLKSEISDYLIDYDTNGEMSDTSLIAPLGKCSTNSGSITLSNVDGRFDNDRATLLGSGAENMFKGLIDKNCRMTLDLGIKVNGTFEYTRQFTMWTDDWNTQNEETVKVTIKDSSKYLQEVKPLSVLYQKLTTGGIVWRLCDLVGFSDYNVSAAALADNSFIDYFWTDPEKTVWEHFEEVSEATQTAIYFNEYDELQVLPRAAAYDLGRGVSWTFDGVDVGDATLQGRLASDNNKLADIEELTQTYDFEANTVNVKYHPTAPAPMKGNVAPMETVWEPEDTTVLRASRLRVTMLSTATTFVINNTDAKIWPYSGIIQVEGEFIQYDSKGYTYRAANGAWVSKYIKSLEEQTALDKLNPNLSYQNYYNGYFHISKRGLWGTTAKTHSVDISGWGYNRYGTTNTSGGNTNVVFWNAGRIHNVASGTMSLKTNKSFTPNSWYVCTRGSRNDSPPYWYGTRLRFDKSGYTYGAAGLVFTAGDYDNGYYVELVRTKAITATDRAKYTNELVFYVKYNNGSIKRIGPNGGKGIPVNIAEGVWYDLDVHFEWNTSGDRVVSIMLNGVTRMTAVVPQGQGTGESIGGRYGVFTRGFTFAEFEYLYASTYAVNETFDQEGWWDRVNGGYQSSQYDKEWTYGYRTNTKLKYGKPPQKVRSRYGSLLMDDFGPVVHEVREFDVTYEKKPVLYSTIYMSNENQVICPEFNASAFGAKFVLANTARINAVVSGEDTTTFGADNAVDQKLLIYGRTITQDDEKTYTVKNDAAINRRGVVEVDIESPWIQTETFAKSIGTWITTHWGGGSDEIEITAVGNPVIQIGDVVAVNYPLKNMTYLKNRYFVVGIAQSFDGGLSTRFTLRRMKS